MELAAFCLDSSARDDRGVLSAVGGFCLCKTFPYFWSPSCFEILCYHGWIPLCSLQGLVRGSAGTTLYWELESFLCVWVKLLLEAGAIPCLHAVPLAHRSISHAWNPGREEMIRSECNSFVLINVQQVLLKCMFLLSIFSTKSSQVGASCSL